MRTLRDRRQEHEHNQPNDKGIRTPSWKRIGITWRKATRYDQYLLDFYRTHTHLDGKWVLTEEVEA